MSSHASSQSYLCIMQVGCLCVRARGLSRFAQPVFPSLSFSSNNQQARLTPIHLPHTCTLHSPPSLLSPWETGFPSSTRLNLRIQSTCLGAWPRVALDLEHLQLNIQAQSYVRDVEWVCVSRSLSARFLFSCGLRALRA